MSTAKAGGCCGGASAGGGCCKNTSTEKKAGGCGGGCACAGKDGVKAVSGGCCKEKVEWDGQMTDELKEHLKSLINTASMTCFIKGSPAEPRCKFSKQLLRFLMDNNVTKIAYHDIMEDNLVRESLKVYSNWKTFPQIYVEGKLLGGIDAVREMHAKGEFLPKVPKECFGKGLYPRIRKVIDQAHVMLFMQGTPSEPKTDEDKQAVNLLKQTGAEFGHFDVTSAEDIAKGTPAYARFTGGYPQLFIGGEYAGGLAFITEKASQSKLADALKKPVPAATSTTTPTAEATKA